MLHWSAERIVKGRFVPGNGKAFIYPTTIDYPGTGKFTDLDISKYVKKHMRLIDTYRRPTVRSD